MPEINIGKAVPQWHPIRKVKDFVRRHPLLHQETSRGRMPETFFSPAFDVKETNDAYEFRADLPGLKEEDIDIQLSEDCLTISGSRKTEHDEKADTYYTYERSYGSFTRSFRLPATTTYLGAHADLKDGVLTLVVPKGVDSKSKRIPIAQTHNG